ncbi:MAG: putative manganese transporter [Bacilli bacterium]|nr:putative manganese transporter [Bacilli bacterium]
MMEVVLETLLDALKLLPFLFVAFLIMEYIEHKFSRKGKEKIEKAGRFGPFFGSLLGAFPQCGFSVMATNLYGTRIITLGTLISIYLSTSDEMLPILISEGAKAGLIFKILLFKIIIGMLFGFLIDFILRNKNHDNHDEIHDFCNDEHCHCEHGIIKSSLKHTLNIIVFIVIITFLLNAGIYYLGEENIGKLFLKDSFLSPFISSLIGLIPNCAASVVITELYLNGVLSFASAVAGLLTGSGVALLVLFKVNKNFKENVKILITLYLIGALTGVATEVITMALGL